MLVLTRKPMQTVLIGDEVRITIVRVGAGQVRLGIEAPRNVVVVRGELRDRDRCSEAPVRLNTSGAI